MKTYWKSIPFEEDLTPEQETNTKEWIANLRSGKFQQTLGKLKDLKGNCCLGVGCENKEDISIKRREDIYDFLFCGADIHRIEPSQSWWRDHYGFAYNYKIFITDDLHISFIELNDMCRFSFNEIADIAESIFIDRTPIYLIMKKGYCSSLYSISKKEPEN